MSRSFFRPRRKILDTTIFETMESRQLLCASPIDPRFISDAQPDIKGTSGDDHIIVTSGQQPCDLIIVSAPGFEPGEVVHNVPNVVIDGGDGNDTIEFRGGEINVTLMGGAGQDLLTGDARNIMFDGGPGNDVITALSGDHEYSADLGFSGALHGVVVRLDLGQVLDDGFGTQDHLSGIGDVEGTPFNDTIYSGHRSFTLYGKGGDDLMVATDDGGPQLVGGMGNDTLKVINDGRAHFAPGPGNDTLIGGAGYDQVTYYEDESDGNLRISMTQGTVVRLDLGWIQDGFGGTDTISDIDGADINSHFGDTIYGTDGNNDMRGGEGPDLVVGGGGNDYLQGGDHSTLLGGDGNDKINDDYQSRTIDGGEGADTIERWGCVYDRDNIILDKQDSYIDHLSPIGSYDCNNPPAETSATRQRTHKKKHHARKKPKVQLSHAAGLFHR
jgi:Ca2+-binding RTX toxin-like protein